MVAVGVAPGCNAPDLDSATCVKRLIEGKYTKLPNGSIRELDILVKSMDAKSLVKVYADSKVPEVFREAAMQIKVIAAFNVSIAKTLKASKTDIVNARGTFFYGDLLICTGNREGMFLLHDSYKEVEASLKKATGPRQRTELLKILSFLRNYIAQITKRFFRSREEYRLWLENEFPKYDLDMSGGGHERWTPGLVKRDS